MNCKGICARYRSSKLEESRLRYAFGDKWCFYCSVFMKWGGRECPCYMTQLRTRPVKRSASESYLKPA
jgi:hypothetical protein